MIMVVCSDPVWGMIEVSQSPLKEMVEPSFFKKGCVFLTRGFFKSAGQRLALTA